MNIALIGMSGSGKTYWSKQLEEKGFNRFGCDDCIEQKLEKELQGLGYKGIADVAKWMGYPFEKQYSQTSKKYLDLEKDTLDEMLHALKNQTNTSEHIVIDTTGSVIYTGEKLLRKLSETTKIIYLKIPDSAMQKMYEGYLQDPKPVFWGDLFQRKSGETDREALERCYFDLLKFRTKQYEKIAHHVIEYNRFEENADTIDAFWDMIDLGN
jgi:shikimate kinase